MEEDIDSIKLIYYFHNPAKIDSVELDPAYEAFLSEDKKTLLVKKINSTPPRLSEARFWINEQSYSLLLSSNHKFKKTIRLASNYKIKSVQLLGEMNNWQENQCIFELKEGIWEKELWLKPGKYQYQLIIDGKRMPDPANPDTAIDGNGKTNSLLTVKQKTEIKAPKIKVLNSDKYQINIEVENADEVFVFWQTYLLKAPCLEKMNKQISFTIPESATYLEESFIRIWAYNETTVSDKLSIPIRLTRKLRVFPPKSIILRQSQRLIEEEEYLNTTPPAVSNNRLQIRHPLRRLCLILAMEVYTCSNLKDVSFKAQGIHRWCRV